ncbi:MAG TPA: ABC transporter ATP-binding protein [Chthoniobacterales bacterium]|nr:ABC transporter ATP-binding protein [Chthoniobacterales bacterium]
MNEKSSTANPAAAPSYVYEAVGLKKAFDDGQVQALRGVDLKIADGEFVAIVGPSGSGKTTLLQMLGALDRPSEGILKYRGQSIFDLPDTAAYRSHEIGFVFQAFHLLPTFTASENVQIPMFEDGKSRSARKNRAFELLKAMGLEHRVNHFPAKLSGGERQRVAIARSLVNSPSVLLADEPTGNLDSESAGHVLELLTSLHRDRKMTLILITHDMDVAVRAERAIQMKDGSVVFDGDPAKLSSHP